MAKQKCFTKMNCFNHKTRDERQTKTLIQLITEIQV